MHSVSPPGPQNVKQLYALVCETQRYSAVLDAVIASAGLLRAEKKLRPHLAKVSGGGRGPSPAPSSAPLSGTPVELERMLTSLRALQKGLTRTEAPTSRVAEATCREGW